MILGVTGNIASGKSRVAAMLRDRGCALVDADKVAHGLYASNPALVREIASEFGEDIILHGGILDRKRLGSRVFGDAAALAALDRIVHPHLAAAIREQAFAATRMMNRVVVDAALIYEWGMEREFGAIILVTAPEALRLARTMERDGLSQEEAEARIRSQMPESEKIPKATYVIENTGTESELEAKVEKVWERITK
ncbi:MAG TPA: dephospho-CoA kinase [Fibrobacteria bacterium]|nr:dephospho-CoA kinase [Fibrobacteria bacterium]